MSSALADRRCCRLWAAALRAAGHCALATALVCGLAQTAQSQPPRQPVSGPARGAAAGLDLTNDPSQSAHSGDPADAVDQPIADVIVEGANSPLADAATPQPAPAVDAIIAEALRDDVETPLFYLAGGGLTDLASAWLQEPRVAERLTLVWIGGAEHEGLAVPPPNARLTRPLRSVWTMR